MIQARINDQSYEITESEGSITVNGKLFDLDIEQLGKTRFHVIKNNKSYRIQIIEQDEAGKFITLNVNGTSYQVSLKTKLDLLLEKLGMESVADKTSNEVKAPMPGLILQVEVEVGAEVKKGDTLLILEAMKMENVIKCPIDGVVSSIQIGVGDSVEKGKILIKL